MSLMAAIDTAVRLQLARDGKRTGPIDYAWTLEPVASATPALGGYDEDGMRMFLEQVSARLRIDVPSLRYDWSGADPATFRKMSILSLISVIARDTTLADGATP